MSGYIVEVFESNSDRVPSLWLAEKSGAWSAVYGRDQSKVFPTTKEAFIAANDFRLTQPDKIAHYMILPK